MSNKISIHFAQLNDIPHIQNIYSHYVLTSTCTMEEVPPTVDEMIKRYNNIIDHSWPWLVAVMESDDNENNNNTEIVGYAYYAQFKERSGYRCTVEASIYLRNDITGKGIGKQLYERLIEIAKSNGFHSIIGCIGDSNNYASIKLHKSLGFEQCGLIKDAGIKFNKWLDVIYMQLLLEKLKIFIFD